MNAAETPAGARRGRERAVRGWACLALASFLLCTTGGCRQNTEEYLQVLDQQRQHLHELSDMLSQISDEASMKSAQESLEKRFEAYESVSARARTLPPPSRSVQAKMAEQAVSMQRAIERLQDQVRRVSALPGGREFWSQFKTRGGGLFRELP